MLLGHHGNIRGVSIFEQKCSSLNNIMTHESRGISFCFFLVKKKLSLIWYWFLKTSSSAFTVHMKAEIQMQAPHLTGTFFLMLLSVRSLGKVSEFCRHWRKLPVTQKPWDSDTPKPGHCLHLGMGLPSLFCLLRTHSSLHKPWTLEIQRAICTYQILTSLGIHQTAVYLITDITFTIALWLSLHY